MMAAEKRSRETRREQIAEAALELLALQGVKRLSVGAVARRIGVVPSAVYRHYRGKEEILSAAIERMGERLLENVRKAGASEEDPVERLRRLLRLHVQTIRSGHSGPRILFSEGIFGGGANHRVEIYRVIRRYLDRVTEVIRQGQQRGDIRKEIDPASAAIHFLGVIQPAATLWYFSDGKFDVTRHAERSFALFADSIRPV
jgi:AcrR family transcriptional regulator